MIQCSNVAALDIFHLCPSEKEQFVLSLSATPNMFRPFFPAKERTAKNAVATNCPSTRPVGSPSFLRVARRRWFAGHDETGLPLTPPVVATLPARDDADHDACFL